MIRTVIEALSEESEVECICGSRAIEVRFQVNPETQEVGDEAYFCFQCAKASDEMRPEDLI